MNSSARLCAALILTCEMVLVGAGQAATPANTPVIIQASPVSFSPLETGRTSFGKLKWRGGLELRAENENFGGFSGLVLNRDGSKMIAVTDRGWWLHANLIYQDGRLAGVGRGSMNELLKPSGKPYKSKKSRDSESIISYTPGDLSRLIVSFERRHRLVQYRASNNGLTGRGRKLYALKSFKTLRYNKGLEAIARFPAGTYAGGRIIAIAERSLDHRGNHLAWLMHGKSVKRLTVKRREEFEITDAAAMPGGDLIILERSITLLGGPRFSLRRIKAKTIRPGAVLDGEVIIEADLRHTIDNMEGLALHRHDNGELRLTLISDDNFSVIQRTLILQFALTE